MGSPFHGLWIDDLKTQMGKAGFDDYLITNGTYRCASCTPPRSYVPVRLTVDAVATVSEPVPEIAPV